MGDNGTGILFVISAPSGAGKTTVVRRLVRTAPGLEFSVSYTTRPPREAEQGGRDYHFLDRTEFEAMVAAGRFLEWAEVHGQLYGTGLEVTRDALAGGADLVLDIDVQGASQVRAGDVASVSTMLLPPDFETLRDRLLGRASEPETERVRRLEQARKEAQDYAKFDYVVVNDDLDRAVEGLVAIVRAERLRAARRAEQVDRIISTFPGDHV